MKEHAAIPQRRRLVRKWLPWLLVAAGMIGLILTFEHRFAQKRQIEPFLRSQPPVPQPVSVPSAGTSPIAPHTEVLQSRSVQPSDTFLLPRRVERLRSDRFEVPLERPVTMRSLDTLGALPPLERPAER